MPLKVLIVHEGGALGRQLLAALASPEVVGHVQVCAHEMSWSAQTAAPDWAAWVPADTDWVVNALALVDPWQIEQETPAGDAFLCAFHESLIDHCERQGVGLFQLSSCYVFDGRKSNAYVSTSHAHPLGKLGRFQWHWEQRIRASLERFLILRTGRFADCYVQRLLGGDPASLMLSSRHVGSVTTYADLVRVMMAMLQQIEAGAAAYGTYQYAGAEDVSEYELGCVLKARLGDACKTQVVDGEREGLAIEPLNARLGCIRLRNTFGIKRRPWRTHLAVECPPVEAVRDAAPQT